MRISAYFCLFISGVAGLVYEVLWAKYLALFVGSTGVAHVIVLCTFMGGMALGGRVLGRWADRVERPLAFYAWLELGIGLYALAFAPVYLAARAAFLAAVSAVGIGAGGLLGAKVLASVITILLPAFLMGGTLPVISRYLIRRVSAVGPVISRLYFVNSLGAVAGCLLAGFYLIATFGLHFTMVTGAALNIGAGLLAMLLSRAAQGRDETPVPAEETKAPEGRVLSRGAVVILLTCVAMSGAVSMGYEVAWIRLLTLVLGSSTYSFSLMLATFIFGLSIGGLLLSLRKKTTGYGVIFGLSEVGVGLLVLLSLPFYVRLPYWFNQIASSLSREPATFGLYQGAKFLLCAGVMFIPTVLQGITLPAATQVLTRETESLGGKVGKIFAINTLGTLLGAALSGVVLMPLLGIKGLLELAVGLNLVLGLLVLVVATGRAERRRALPAAMAGIVIIGAGYMACMGPWDREVLTAGIYRTRDRIPSFAALKERANERGTVFYRDGLYATVAVQDLSDGERILVVNGKVDASSVGDLPTQKGLTHLSFMNHPSPKRILIVGVGSGATIGSVLDAPGVEHVDVVEISGDIVEASRYFASINGSYWNDPRVTVYREDAKTFLQVTDAAYDVIISEPTNPWIAGIAGVFSQEYFVACREHLAEGGLFVQWIQAYDQEDTTFYLVLETFSSVFPCYTLWNTTRSDTVLVGSPTPYTPDFERIEAYVASPGVQADLNLMGASTALPLLGMQMADHAQRPSHIAWFGTVHTDLFPILEYTAPRGFFLGSHAEGAKLLDQRTEPASALWLTPYLASREVPAAAFREVYHFLLKHKGMVDRHAWSWVDAWRTRYPEDVEAHLAWSGQRPPDRAAALLALEPVLARGDEDARGFAAHQALALRLNDYAERRHALSREAEPLLVAVNAFAEARPGAYAMDIARWQGLLLSDLGRYDEAIPSLKQALLLADHPERTVQVGLLLCHTALRAHRPDIAAATLQDHLAEQADLLEVHLMMARTQQMLRASPGQVH